MAQRGGKRTGAGRPPGLRWSPPAKSLRADAVEKALKIVNSGDDPLSVVSGWVMNEKLEPSFRLSAAACVLPYLYPRLSASQVDAKLTVTKVDSSEVVQRLEERLQRMITPTTIEAKIEQPLPSIEIIPPEEDET